MKTTINLYNNDGIMATMPKIQVTSDDVIAKNPKLAEYEKKCSVYDEFCKNQTKTGQSRKNERGNFRRKLFSGLEKESELSQKLYFEIKNEKQKSVKPDFKVVIDFDGRKKGNLHKIIEGICMFLNVGEISDQYYSLGLRSFENKSN